MTEFRTLDEADDLLAHYSGQPFVKGRARQLAGLGVLKISIRYRGPIGQFPITENVPTISTEAVKRYPFDGYLTATARPRLDVTGVKFSKKGKKNTCHDILTVIEVTHDHVDFQPEPGNFIGRVVTWKDELDRTHVTQNLNTGDIPVSDWLISSDEIGAYCAQSKTREGAIRSSVPEATVATDQSAAPRATQPEAAEPAPQVAAMGAASIGPADSDGARKKWTKEKLGEISLYRGVHTMPETAAKFGISEQRIRQLLPSKRPTANLFPGVINKQK